MSLPRTCKSRNQNKGAAPFSRVALEAARTARRASTTCPRLSCCSLPQVRQLGSERAPGRQRARRKADVLSLYRHQDTATDIYPCLRARLSKPEQPVNWAHRRLVADPARFATEILTLSSAGCRRSCGALQSARSARADPPLPATQAAARCAAESMTAIFAIFCGSLLYIP